MNKEGKASRFRTHKLEWSETASPFMAMNLPQSIFDVSFCYYTLKMYQNDVVA